MLPAIVDGQELVAANSGLWSAAAVSQIALAPAGGALVATWGVAPAFWLNAASFAISAAILTRLRAAGPPQSMAVGSWGRRITEGGRLLIAERLLRLLAAVQLLAALSAGATSALLVILAERRLHAGPGGFGLLLGAIGAGAAFGPLLLARFTSNPRRPALVFGPYRCAAWSISSWPAPAACRSPWPPSACTGSAPQAGWSPTITGYRRRRIAGGRRQLHPHRAGLAVNLGRPGGVTVSVVAPVGADGTGHGTLDEIRSVFFVVEPDRVQLGELAGRIDAGRLRPVVGRVADLADGSRAWAAKQSGGVPGKVVLRPPQR